MDRRKRLRLTGFDYALPGAYFITVCAAGRGALFGEVVNATVRLNSLGLVVAEAPAAFPDHHDAAVDTSVVMPITSTRSSSSCARRDTGRTGPAPTRRSRTSSEHSRRA